MNFQSIEEFIVDNGLVNCDMEKYLISEFLSRPLTLFHAYFRLLNKQPAEKVTVHIIGSTEIDVLSYWPYLLKLQPDLEYQLIFIGLEAPEFHHEGTNMKIISSTGSYHEFPDIARPDMIVSYNCGFAEFAGTSNDAWTNSFPSILAHRVPIVLTSFTKTESKFDANLLLETDSELRVRYFKNPFASLTPLRDVEGPGVYFINNYLSIIDR